jgi:hypothetical protein
MPDHFYGLDKSAGLEPNSVRVGTSSIGQNLELRTRDGVGLQRMDVVNGLRTLLAFFEKPTNFPVP